MHTYCVTHERTKHLKWYIDRGKESCLHEACALHIAWTQNFFLTRTHKRAKVSFFIFHWLHIFSCIVLNDFQLLSFFEPNTYKGIAQIVQALNESATTHYVQIGHSFQNIFLIVDSAKIKLSRTPGLFSALNVAPWLLIGGPAGDSPKRRQKYFQGES